MSIEEAIKCIRDIRDYYTPDRDFSYYGEEYTPLDAEDTAALNMAIRVLGAIPKIREELSDLLATDNELFGISDALRVIDKYIPKE